MQRKEQRQKLCRLVQYGSLTGSPENYIVSPEDIGRIDQWFPIDHKINCSLNGF